MVFCVELRGKYFVQRLVTDITGKIITIQTKLTVTNNPVWYAITSHCGDNNSCSINGKREKVYIKLTETKISHTNNL